MLLGEIETKVRSMDGWERVEKGVSLANFPHCQFPVSAFLTTTAPLNIKKKHYFSWYITEFIIIIILNYTSNFLGLEIAVIVN